MFQRTHCLSALIVYALLMFVGCGEKDNASALEAARLRAELAKAETELQCKVAVLTTSCSSGDTTCETNKANALSACATGASAAYVVNSTSTATETSVVTVTSVSTSSSTTTVY